MHITRRMTPGLPSFLCSCQTRPRCLSERQRVDNSSWPPRAAEFGSCVRVSEGTSAANKLRQRLQRLTGAAKDPAIPIAQPRLRHPCQVVGREQRRGPLIEPSLTCNSMRHTGPPQQGQLRFMPPCRQKNLRSVCLDDGPKDLQSLPRLVIARCPCKHAPSEDASLGLT